MRSCKLSVRLLLKPGGPIARTRFSDSSEFLRCPALATYRITLIPDGVQITDLNAHGGIGSNCLHVRLGAFSIIIDSGLSPKHAGFSAVPRFEALPPEPPDLIILTHNHLDHLGTLPLLMQRFPDSPVVMSATTERYAARMLHNSCNVMQYQRDEEGIPEYPLFTHSQVDRVSRRFVPLPYEHPRFFNHRNGDSLTITLHMAGHVPGAAAVTLEHRHRKVFFTGDVLFAEQRILDGARLPSDPVDTLVMETTRGARSRPEGQTRESEVQAFLQTIRDTCDRGGKVLVPVFALGRTQEIIAILREAKARNELPKVPVFGSGLGIDLAEIFDDIARTTGMVWFKKQWMRDLEMKKLNGMGPRAKLPEGPALYVVSSGMLIERTPSYAVAASLAADPRNAILFVGYCDPSTPGGKLLQATRGAPFAFPAARGDAPVLNALVKRFDLSSHADREELLQYAVSVKPRCVVLTHGDQEARDWFSAQFEAHHPKIKVLDPQPLVTVEA